MRLIFIFAGMMSLISCSSSPQYRQAMKMSIGEYKNKVTIDESSSNRIVIISSEKAFPKAPEITESEKDDNYVRALVNKSNGMAIYQIVNSVHYEAEKWRFFEQVEYLSRDGMEQNSLTVIEHRVEECSVFSGCQYRETVGFEIPELIVKNGAERYDPEVVSGLKYKLIDRNGNEYKNIIFSQELIAVLNAVEEYKRVKLGVPKKGFVSY